MSEIKLTKMCQLDADPNLKLSSDFYVYRCIHTQPTNSYDVFGANKATKKKMKNTNLKKL